MRWVTLLMISLFILPEFGFASTVSRHTFSSNALNGDYAYTIYLPDNYEEKQDTVYPVVYLLHGSLSDDQFWVNSIDVKTKLDKLIATGKIPPTIAVMPCSKSWWVNGFNEPAETAFIKDLVPHIDQRWRTIQNRSARLLGGISAGGYGTVNFAMKYPHMFVSGAAFSPATYEDLPPEGSSSYTHPTYLNQDQKFDEKRWRELNYPSFISAYKQQEHVVALYINSGDHDRLDIAYHATLLYQKLRIHQPEKIELRIVDGDHEPKVWINTFSEAMEYIFKFASSKPISKGDKSNKETP